ncbi:MULTISPECIES: YesL family protein [Turicibacter]|jgi:hypothetical protein|uniref:DUF624 domain-containing protein n=2 Tax=Turicibacter sanguinis TaxID=154288 RepID=A0A173R0G2_9FIRM|nr:MULTISPECIES: YesL family protein [Turicibacter]EFF63077.1 conserved hypothetical protein [Turicibacter sanguinis PC909]EGC93209.1 hypothetical protein HMPREF9402_1959 [Turicibacter sp. HGF1]MBP3903761.1 YesL family protein [Turicibacter sp.]MCU7190735.1 YesL family protein [Turicibacter sanguinis]MCU7196223.1 YesL family protein [Turicibacter sanguinis]
MASQYDDNLFFKMIYAISDIAVLSILWFIGSLPLVTIGASTTALFYVCGKKVKQDEPKIISEFIKSYKENFKQSFLITGILAILWYGTLTYFMMSFSALKEGFNGSVVVMLVLAFEVVMMSVYMCALLAKYELRTIQIIRNSFLFIHAYFIESIKAFGLIIAIIFCLLLVPGIVIVLPGAIGLTGSIFIRNSIHKFLVRQKAVEELRQEQAIEC